MNSLTPPELATRDSYDKAAALWEGGHQKPFWVEEFQELKSLLLGGKVIEVGFGAGRDAKELDELGYDYFGVDISEGMVEEARKNAPGLYFEPGSVYEIPQTHEFDAFWCAATLIHVPKARIHEALSALSGATRTGGYGFISVKEGNGEGMEVRDELEGQAFWFTYYQPEVFEQFLRYHKMDILSQRQQYVSPRTTWLRYLVQVN